MAIAHSKLTAQGQISVPAEIRKKLGVGPGSVLEWDEHGQDGDVIVRRAARYTSVDISEMLFPEKPPHREAADIKEGIRRHIRRRHARD